MLYLNVNEQVMREWGRSIDLYYSLYLANLGNEIRSVNLVVEEEVQKTSDLMLYKVGVSVIPNNGPVLRFTIEQENCGEAIEQCFAKAKRSMVRKIRGLSVSAPFEPALLGNVGN